MNLYYTIAKIDYERGTHVVKHPIVSKSAAEAVEQAYNQAMQRDATYPDDDPIAIQVRIDEVVELKLPKK